jgi:hypothetical protein
MRIAARLSPLSCARPGLKLFGNSAIRIPKSDRPQTFFPGLTRFLVDVDLRGLLEEFFDRLFDGENL